MHTSECFKSLSVYRASVVAVSTETSGWAAYCPHITTYSFIC